MLTKNKLLVCLLSFLLLFVLLCPHVGHAAGTIRTPQDVVTHIENNFDLKLLKENTRQATANLEKILAALYYPSINGTAAYTDNRQEQTIPFYPSKTQNAFWSLYLQSHTPVGVQVEGGKSLLRSYYGTATVANDLMPLPMTVYQPQAYLKVSLDLSRDLLGYVTQKGIEVAKTGVTQSQKQEALLKHKLAVTALELFYQIPVLERIRFLSHAMVRDFQTLESSLSQRAERSLVENSDLFSIRALIAQYEALLQDTDKALTELKQAVATLLGDPGLIVAPVMGLSQVQQNTQRCEQRILQTAFDTGLSGEFALLTDQLKAADLSAKVAKRAVWPDVKAYGTLTGTGTDTGYGAALEEVGGLDRPIYEAGLALTWQPSKHQNRAAEAQSQALKQAAVWQQHKRLVEQSALWKTTQKNVKTLREKTEHLSNSLIWREREVRELLAKYELGRIGLFELTQERVNLLQTNITYESVRRERMSTVMGALAYFDQFSCDLVK